MSPVNNRLRVVAISSAVILSLLSMGSIAVGQTQKLQDRLIVSSKLNLTMEQRHIIKESIKELKVENEPRKMQIGVGRVIPKTVLLRAIPFDASAKVSQVKNHSYFLKNDQIVLVDPKDNVVVDVIDLR